MKVEWFLGRSNPEEKDRVKKLLRENVEALEHLKEVIQKKFKDNSSTSDYDNPSWAYWQADRNGYNRALKEINDLIQSIKEE